MAHGLEIGLALTPSIGTTWSHKTSATRIQLKLFYAQWSIRRGLRPLNAPENRMLPIHLQAYVKNSAVLTTA
ncbi:hypothetical protein K474DRAFT_1670677 [Panus rudis PR-1116 ss-1]|nr:hypothetical protein K474DRAFT_1670677 [Panus rudis PR-1116 ss-1]